MIAYHFVGNALRDGRPVPPDGEKLVHDGPLKLRHKGLHACLCPFDALIYAPGPVLCRVECGGEIITGDDKLVCTERTIIARRDVSDMLRRFARQCALDVIHLWDAPPVVREYLETGEESKRAAAARAAAQDVASRAAARAAAQDVASRAAARAAARDVDRAAAVWAAARAAAAWAAARDAAACAAAWDATWENQRQRFRQMVEDAFAEVAA